MLSLENNLAKNSNLLEVKIKNYEECGFCQDGENKEILKIPWDIWSQWLFISQKMGTKEWGAVFWVKANTITEFKIPKQEVNSTECEFKEELGGDGIIHSHHDMGAFHSPQDNHHARNLYCYSIVISNARGYEATKRIKLPCAGFGYVRVELHLINCPEIDLSKITEKALLSDVYLREENQRQFDFKPGESPCDKCVTHDCENCGYFDPAYFPCDNCSSFKCKECQHIRGMDISEVLPFCDFCEDYQCCQECVKLMRYLENYPQDRKQFTHLYSNKP